MASDQSSAAGQAARTQGQLANEAYGVAIPALSQQYGFLRGSIAEGGEPGYVRDAYAAQRTGITEGLGRQGQMQERQALASGKAAALGGNLNASLTPQTMGAQIADQLYSSRLNEGMGRVEQLNKLLAMGLGQSTQAGNAAIGAGQAQLQGIAGMPAYNSTYAKILAGLNVAGSAYGGYQGYMAGQQAIYDNGGV